MTALHHVADGPRGAPVLLMGGSLGSTTAMWEPQLEPLASRVRVVRYDHAGHGGSPVPPGGYELADLAADALALMDRLRIARASYCGLSLGGMVGMWLAAHAPERIGRLVLLCTSAHIPGTAYAERAATVRAGGTTEVVADAVLSRWVTQPFAAANPDTVAALRAMLVSIPAEGYAACCEVIDRMDLRAELAAIRAPTLVISGADDPATPPDHGWAIASGIRGAHLEILSPAAHLANVERAADVNRLVLDHVAPRFGRVVHEDPVRRAP